MKSETQFSLLNNSILHKKSLEPDFLLQTIALLAAMEKTMTKKIYFPVSQMTVFFVD